MIFLFILCYILFIYLLLISAIYRAFFVIFYITFYYSVLNAFATVDGLFVFLLLCLGGNNRRVSDLPRVRSRVPWWPRLDLVSVTSTVRYGWRSPFLVLSHPCVSLSLFPFSSLRLAYILSPFVFSRRLLQPHVDRALPGTGPFPTPFG